MVSVPHPLCITDKDNRTWSLYDVEFTSPDGTYSVFMYAISDEHAEMQLMALKETGYVAGCVVGVLPEEGNDDECG